MTMTDVEAAALLHITNSPGYLPGMLTLYAAADSRDESIMWALSVTPRDYPARMEQAAFVGMSGHEIYVASGRAEIDARAQPLAATILAVGPL